MISAITFDFWDTMAVDDSDEPKRAALGLPTKAESRIQLFVEKVTERHPQIEPVQAREAYQQANAIFRQDWHKEARTPSVTTRIFYAYDYLGLTPAPGAYAKLVREVDELVREIETMEIRIPPDFAPDIHSTLQFLGLEYKLGIISDTIHTHGRGLRFLLQQQGLLQYFDYFVFSDEVRAAKPATTVFRHAALGLGFPTRQIVHIGDREQNDVTGPLSVGMRSILYTGIVDRGSKSSRAHAICRHFREIPYLVRQLS